MGAIDVISAVKQTAQNSVSSLLSEGQKKRIGDVAFDRKRKIGRRIDDTDSVLAVGCVKHSVDETNIDEESEFLLKSLAENAGDVVGVDIVEEEVEKLRQHGYEVYAADAQRLDLDATFDKIVAGEVIEHLENPGQFLTRCKRHLNDGGEIVLTTPNPRRLQMLLWFLLDVDSPGNEEHTMWFDWFVMEELASRVGLEIVSYQSYAPGYLPVSLLLYHFGIAENLTAGGWVFVLAPDGE